MTAGLNREMPFRISDGGGRLVEPFSPSALLFMQEWLAVRRKGQDFLQNMMGEMCQGRRLDKPDAREDDGEVDMMGVGLLEHEGEDSE